MKFNHHVWLFIVIASAFRQVVAESIGVNENALHHLFQNTLNYTANSVSHQGFLFFPRLTSLDSASSLCSRVSENLINIEALSLSSSTDLVHLLRYQVFLNNVEADQKFWVSQNTRDVQKKTECRAVHVQNSRLLIIDTSCSDYLPTLCTQSAPYSNSASHDTDPKWQLAVRSQGRTFVGYRDYASFRFMGIPFANAPRRFEYSTLYSGTQTLFQAVNPGPHCVQAGDSNVSEDCLFLNIFTPFLPGSGAGVRQLKPVMFWIHGGAFTGGTGSDSTFDGGALASRGDVVLVTINYRLSTLGFLALNDGVVKGNYGLADQITALHWVQQNIAAFGGDPDRVTIFGQSAGAGSVRALLGSSKAKGLFHAAIPMSNLAGADYATTYSLYFTQAEEVSVAANAIISATNCSNPDPAAVRSCLLKVPGSTLVTLPTVARFVVVDGTYITSTSLPLNGRSPNVSKVPTMWGWMAFDGAPFIGFPRTGQSFEQALLSLGVVNQTMASIIVQSGLFPVPSTGNATLDVFNATSRVTTDLEFRCLDQATVVAAAENDVFSDIFAYQFDRSYQTPGFSPNFPTCEAPITASDPNGDPDLPYLQCHSGELYYVFGTLGQFSLPYRDEEDLLFNQYVLDTWASFAHTHDPNLSITYLKTRGYMATLQHVMQEKSKWAKITRGNIGSSQVLRRFDGVITASSPFLETDQCNLLGFPLDFYS